MRLKCKIELIRNFGENIQFILPPKKFDTWNNLLGEDMAVEDHRLGELESLHGEDV